MKRTLWTAMWLASATVAIVIVTSAATAAQEYTVRMNGANGPMTIYVSRNAIRRAEPGFTVDVIYRLSEGKIIYIDHQKKTYSEVTFAEARQRAAKAAADMTPQQKAMMSRMGVNATPSFTKLGPAETIAGYATEKYVMKTPAMETEISAAPAPSLPPGYYEAFRTGAGVFGAATQSSEAMNNIHGMILKRVGTTTMMNRVTTTEVATSVDKAPIPLSAFEPPAGYKNVPKEF